MKQINFPDNGFLIILFMLNNGEIAAIHPMYDLFETKESASAYLEWMINDLYEKGENVEVADAALCIPLKFNKNVILKKSLLKKNNKDVSGSERQSLFMPLIKKSKSLKILVIKNDKEVYKTHDAFTIVSPINTELSLEDGLNEVKFNNIKNTNNDIEAGLYNFGEPEKLNWKEGKKFN